MITLGVIGMSPGNAHPYSWSAIINGFFDADEITAVGYPGVSAYLNANRDTVGLSDARVTHVWTQDRAISESIAKASGVETVVDRLEDLIGQVDAVLLTRDDPENHVAMARPFLEAGVPLFIDKPLAVTTKDLDYFAEQHAQGRFFMSCSSMRYAGECRTARTELAALGPLQLVTAVGKKDWPKYGVHMLEALFAILDDPKAVAVKHVGKPGKDIVYIEFENGLQAVVNIFMEVTLTFQISLFGQNGWRLVDIRNSYAMFRDNIMEFVRSVREGQARLPFHKTENIIRTLIGAQTSLEQDGKTIDLCTSKTY